MDSMKISMRSDTTIQPSFTSPSAVSQHSTVNQHMDQFACMKPMLSSFPGQETTRTAFCNYLASEVEDLKDKNFQTFRNKALKLLSGIQSVGEERTHQPQPPQQPTLSRSSNATSTFVPQNFQQPYQPAPAG